MDYWDTLEKLISENGITIDRPKGTSHPRYPGMIYRVNYGFINNTRSMDGNEIDVFEGESEKKVNGIFCTIDTFKQDSEIKVLYACDESDIATIGRQLNETDYMKAIFIARR
jgi:inorganic pyrophosphatase